MVAQLAGGDAVLPGVLPASAAREHVVNRLAMATAIGALVVVSAHQGRPGERYAITLRDAHVAAQPDEEGVATCTVAEWRNRPPVS